MPAGFKSRPAKGRVDLSRPVADLNVTGITRQWRDIQVQDVQEGDTIAGMGVVLTVLSTCRGEVFVEAGIPESKTHKLEETTVVKAFVKKEN